MTEESKDSDRIELSNGVILRIKDISRTQLTYAIRNMQKEHPEPQPPMVHIEDRGRDEPNANDPAYLEAKQVWQIDVASRMMNVLYWDALEVVEVPDDVPKADSPEFEEYMEFVMGESVARSEQARKVQWLRYRAIPEDNLLDVQYRLLRLAGVPEEDIVEIEATFRSDAGGNPDTASLNIESSQNGD